MTKSAKSVLYPAKARGWWELRDIVKQNKPFHNNGKTFRGELHNPDNAWLPSKGHMPEADRNTMDRIHKMYGIDYVVFSYYTPIAYRDRRGIWTVPNAKYSRTTTQHQGRINVVASQLMKEMESAA